MIVLAAPYSAIARQIALPNPLLDDSFGSKADLDIQRSMNGTRYTYVKSKSGRQRLLFELRLSRMKALQLLAFVELYHSTPMRLTDHLGAVWKVNLLSNPAEFRTQVRAAFSPGNEMGVVQVELEGFKQ